MLLLYTNDLFQEPARELDSEEKHGTVIYFLLWCCYKLVILVLVLEWVFYCFSHGFLAVGGLVKKILETKKDYELTPSSPKTKEQVCTTSNCTSSLHKMAILS